MGERLRVLILEDRAEDVQLLVHQLRRSGYEPVWERVETEADYRAMLNEALDIILADYNLPQFDAPCALRLLRQRGLDVPFVIVSGSIGEDTAVAAMKEGASDYLLKDRLGRLGEAVKQALEQKRLRADKRQAEELLRGVLAFSPAVIYSLKLHGDSIRPAWVSENIQTMMGYSTAEALAAGWWEAGLHPADAPSELARWPNFLRDGRLISEYRFRHKDGTYRWVRDEKQLLRDTDGRPSECVGSWSDITERKSLEEQFRQA